LTWSAGLPSSSSHALIGGLVGAGLVAGLVAIIHT
jgi:PiT family inorganic phosphate transporter